MPDDLVRDNYAQVRTILANERTLLAYVRTALTSMLTGIGLMKFFDSPLLIGLGVAFVPTGVAVLVVGLWRFRMVRESVAQLQRQAPPGGG